MAETLPSQSDASHPEPRGVDLTERRLRALIDAGRAVVSQLDLETILHRVLQAARELTGAKYAALGILDEERRRLERFVSMGIDDATRRRIGNLPTGKGVLGVLIDDPKPLRIEDVSTHPQSAGFPPGHPPMHTFLGVPISIRGVAWGNLYLTEKVGGDRFTEADEEAATILADCAAIAVDHSRSVDRARLRQSIESAERERGRWARELHDETLQGLGALRVSLASALRTGADHEAVISEAVAQLTDEIRKLRGLISELRPASLDEIGLQAALEALAEQISARNRIEVDAVVALAFEAGAEPERLDRGIEEAIYRVAQEGLTNAVKHAHAERIAVKVVERGHEIVLTVSDGGRGFDPGTARRGYGLTGIEERVELVGGSVEVESAPGGGTTITAKFPALRAGSDTRYGPGAR
jgi:two-component system, NarL family, sensor histidine kinase DevS